MRYCVFKKDTAERKGPLFIEVENLLYI